MACANTHKVLYDTHILLDERLNTSGIMHDIYWKLVVLRLLGLCSGLYLWRNISQLMCAERRRSSSLSLSKET